MDTEKDANEFDRFAINVFIFEIKRVEGGDAGWISSTCVHCVHNVYSTAVDPSSLLRL